MLLSSNEIEEVKEVKEILVPLEDKKQHDLLENQNNLIKDLLDKQEVKEKELKEKELKEKEEIEVYSLQYEQEQQIMEHQIQLLQNQNQLLEQTLEHIVEIENHNQSIHEVSIVFIGLFIGIIIVKSFIDTIFKGV